MLHVDHSGLKMFRIQLLICVVMCYVIQGAKLPSYFKKCSISDPNLNECFIKAANDAIPTVVRGDKKLKIPNMLPLKIDEVKLEPSPNLNIKMTQLEVYGLEDAKVTDAKVELSENKLQLTVFIPRVVLLGHYEVHGRILVLPVEGEGPSNITLTNGRFVYGMMVEFSEKKGERYATIVDNNISYKSEKTYFKLDNLFNGNQELSDQVNQFLNENSQDVERDLTPAVSETISVIITSILNSIFRLVPYEDVILP